MARARPWAGECSGSPSRIWLSWQWSTTAPSGCRATASMPASGSATPCTPSPRSSLKSVSSGSARPVAAWAAASWPRACCSSSRVTCRRVSAAVTWVAARLQLHDQQRRHGPRPAGHASAAALQPAPGAMVLRSTRGTARHPAAAQPRRLDSRSSGVNAIITGDGIQAFTVRRKDPASTATVQAVEWAAVWNASQVHDVLAVMGIDALSAMDQLKAMGVSQIDRLPCGDGEHAAARGDGAVTKGQQHAPARDEQAGQFGHPRHSKRDSSAQAHATGRKSAASKPGPLDAGEPSPALPGRAWPPPPRPTAQAPR